ncbi:MAG: formimidoylglutamate deiminase [Rhodospirillales bacterium]
MQQERVLFASWALLPQGWCRSVRIGVDAEGWIVSLESEAEAGEAERLAGPLIPGMPNLHSHAFQRAMAGLGEVAGAGDDSFWTWRQVMYGFLRRIRPEQVQAIAAQLYVEMLKGGYTAVGEFHYLHHAPDGQPYADRAEMARRTLAAAAESGIGITQLPVLYGYGGFGAQPAGEGQRRFLNSPEQLLEIVSALQESHKADPQVAVGLAPHSLRAVTEETLRAALEGLTASDPQAPIHLHIAEQTKEVEDCEAWSGQRPLAWLLDRFAVDRRWCLIHATHIDGKETAGLAASGAVAGLCPTTEANLGDGFFPALDYRAAGGRFGIGSDSHISVSAIEDLRWLEYGQRLRARGRNLLTGGPADPHCGAWLYRQALAGGAQALGRPVGALAVGQRADGLVLDGEHPLLACREGDAWLDALVFAGNDNPIRDVLVGGTFQVEAGRHRNEEVIKRRYLAALKELTA